MCGRYWVDVEDFDDAEVLRVFNELNEKFGYTEKSKEVFPTDHAPVLVFERNGLVAHPYRWGFPRSNNKGVVINARAETALEKSMFRNSLIHNRCVIVSSGFYEWQKADPSKPKTKYLFNEPQRKPLYLAGMYGTFPELATTNSFVILTTDANSSISDIHDRMPVILGKDEILPWLTDNEFMSDALYRTGPELTKKPHD